MNNNPYLDAGIAQVWSFAHPDEKLVTGPFYRFAQMIKGVAGQILIDHRSHKIELVSETEKEALFVVSVTALDGKQVIYRWNVKKACLVN